MIARIRRLTTVLLVVLAAGAADQAQAQNYPSRPLRILIPFPPGGAPDVLARLVGDKLAASLGQRVVAENKPGAGGNIASEAAAQAAPDGYTIYLAAHPPFTLNPMLYANAPYDAVKDFEPIALLGSQWFIVTVNPVLPARTIQELVRYIKARPGQLSYASSGAGSPQHLGMEFIKLRLGLDMVHVPYRGATASLPDLLSGQIPLAFTSLAIARQHFDSGKLIPLAVTSRTRAPQMPNLPTVAESFIPGYEVTAWFGIFAPARTPQEIVTLLNREIVAMMRLPDVQERMVAMGLDTKTSTPEELGAIVRNEIATWGPVVKDAKLKVE
jgi:tripartite-type tricarboxylate transporter receptor subunit TctC